MPITVALREIGTALLVGLLAIGWLIYLAAAMWRKRREEDRQRKLPAALRKGH